MPERILAITNRLLVSTSILQLFCQRALPIYSIDFFRNPILSLKLPFLASLSQNFSTITLLKEQAREAKRESDNSKEGFKDYNKGQVMAYCTAISTLKNQAPFFDLTQEDIGLADIDPERDLV